MSSHSEQSATTNLSWSLEEIFESNLGCISSLRQESPVFQRHPVTTRRIVHDVQITIQAMLANPLHPLDSRRVRPDPEVHRVKLVANGHRLETRWRIDCLIDASSSVKPPLLYVLATLETSKGRVSRDVTARTGSHEHAGEQPRGKTRMQTKTESR